MLKEIGREIGSVCKKCDVWLKVNWSKPKDGMYCPKCGRQFYPDGQPKIRLIGDNNGKQES